ncbi:MAG: YceI family protein [Nevskiales bacterium]
MKSFHSPRLILIVGATAFALAACSKSESPAPPAAKPSVAAAPTPAPVQITAPAGTYTLDPYHSSISFGINHLGLSNYVARFTRYQATLNFDPANLAASSVTATIEPASVRTDFSGDYPATHKDTPYKTFDEALAKDAKFFNSGAFPQITFTSKRVEQTAPGRFTITGDLGFLGKTLPVTLDTTVVGSVAAHPFTQIGAIGFSATTRIKRSEFGMTEYLQMLGDEVTIRFEGEFHQQAAAPAAAPAASPAS